MSTSTIRRPQRSRAGLSLSSESDESLAGSRISSSESLELEYEAKPGRTPMHTKFPLYGTLCITFADELLLELLLSSEVEELVSFEEPLSSAPLSSVVQ